MKGLVEMKNRRKNRMFIGSIAAILIISAVVGTALHRPKRLQTEETNSTPNSSDTSLKIPEISQIPNTSQTESEVSDNAKPLLPDIILDVGDTQEEEIQKEENIELKEKAEKPAAPIITKKPKENNENKENNNNDIGIKVGDEIVLYECGSPNHNCNNAEAHAFIQNLELQGCPFCHSHTCPSFYGKDEWGFTKYNQKLCPRYDEKNDPTKYCQSCGREMWSKDNPTGCFRYLQDTECECGKLVKGNTCHHH